MKPLRLVPDDTHIHFMRGRYAGLIVSAILSTLSIVLFFYPGLNYSIDFKGGSVIELRMAVPTHEDDVRTIFDQLPYGDARVQQFGSDTDFLVRLDSQLPGPMPATRSSRRSARNSRASRSGASRRSVPRSAASCSARG